MLSKQYFYKFFLDILQTFFFHWTFSFYLLGIEIINTMLLIILVGEDFRIKCFLKGAFLDTELLGQKVWAWENPSYENKDTGSET